MNPHPAHVPPGFTWREARALRQGDAATLGPALRRTRSRTLALARAWHDVLGEPMQVPRDPALNPPLWELGHIGWFQDWWVSRNRQRHLGVTCDPDHARARPRVNRADDFYNSSTVPHDTRWALPLPGWKATLDDLAAGLDATLALLDGADEAQLYFFRLVLFHEDMHNEAWVYMARALDIALPVDAAMPAGSGRRHAHAGARISLPGGQWRLGSADEAGFAFDNELAGQTVALDAFDIDAAPVSWRMWLQFAQDTGRALPPFVRGGGGMRGQWELREHGRWHELDLDSCARHLSLHDAQDWCAWAGRRLPTEAQWEYAAMTAPGFEWGQVWEWTASVFEPYAGFRPHPYVDYSQPWFGDRQVLRGACMATAPGMRHPRYRNFFHAHRTDIYSGFRSCSA